MTAEAPDDRAAALSSLDVGALSDALADSASAVPALAPMLAVELLRRSLARLMMGSGGAAGGPTPDIVAADLQRNGVGAMLQQLAESPARLGSLTSMARIAAMADRGVGLKFPTAGGVPPVPVVNVDRVLGRLMPLTAQARQHSTTFARLAQLSTTMGTLSVGMSGKAGAIAPAFGSAAGVLNLPSLPAVPAQPWRMWGVGMTSLSGTIGALRTNLDLDPARGISVDALTRRLESSAAPMPAVSIPSIDVGGLGSLVAALGAIDLARHQLSVDLLKTGWQSALLRVTSAVKSAQAQLVAMGPPALPALPAIESASALRATLAGMNRLDGALGFSLRSGDAAQRLQGVLQPLEQAAASPSVCAIGSQAAAGDRSLLQRLLRELARVYQSLMLPAVPRVHGAV